MYVSELVAQTRARVAFVLFSVCGPPTNESVHLKAASAQIKDAGALPAKVHRRQNPAFDAIRMRVGVFPNRILKRFWY